MQKSYATGFAPSCTAAGHRTAMGRLLLMTLSLLLALSMPSAMKATIVTIGEGTSTQHYPLPGFFGYQYDVYIYTPTAAPALEADCDISSIAFNVATNNTEGKSSMEIWVKDVDADYALAAATTFDDYTADAELVYENDDFTSTTGWNTLAFTQDFSHQGGKALLVAVRGVGCGTTACSRYCTYTSVSNTTWYKHQDNSDPGTNVSGIVGYSRANIQLDLTYTGAVCLSPSGLAASNITDNSATLSWNENGEATAWVLQYGTDSEFVTYTEENVSTTPSFGLTGLTALTTYYARVKPDCDTDGSHWSNTATFSTTAVAERVGYSWSDDFEGANCGWELINGALTNKWAWGTAANNGGTHGLYISNDGGTSNAYSHSSTMVYATKLLNFTEGKYEFSYDWLANGESTYDFLRVALVPATVTLTAGTSYPSGFGDSSLPSGWIALDGGSKLNLATAWQNKSLTINVPAGNYYLVLAWRNDGNGGTQPPAAVDNVSITQVTCPYDVTGLAVSNITTTGATLTWTAGEAEQWQVAYSTNSTFEGAAEKIVSEASYEITELQPGTYYYAKVRAYCGGTDFGSWSTVLQFNTDCLVIDLSTVDFSENFDDYSAVSMYTPTERILPVCWNAINTCTYDYYKFYPVVSSYSSSSYANSGSNYLKFYSMYSSSSEYDPQPQYAILPAMEKMEGMQITLWARGYNTTSTFKIGMMTDPADASTFTMIAEQKLTTSYDEYSFILGEGNYVAIMMEAANSSTTTKGVYIDDITIAEAPSCIKPSDLTFVSATTTEATLSWTNGAATQTAWQIAYSTDSTFDPDEVTPVDVTSNPGTIDGLTASTIYYAYVRANCGNGDYSDWSKHYCTFATECGAITKLPWREDFDYYIASSTSTTPNTYPNDNLPVCWQLLNRSETTNTYPQVFISSYSSYVISGNCLFFKSSSTTPLYAILPVFNNNLSELQLTFTYRNEGTTTYNGTLIVGYMTDPTDATTFNPVYTCEITTTLTEVDVLFPNDTPGGSYIAFKYEGGSSNNYYLSIDNVSVDFVPSCQKPQNLEWVSSTTTTATLTWTPSGGETEWQICINGDEDNLINVEESDFVNNSFTLQNLSPSTTYTAKVRAYCNENDQSKWCDVITFTTPCGAVTTFPWSEGFENGELSFCWEQEGNGTWTVKTGGTGAHTGSYNAQITHGTTGNVTKLITPMLDLTSLNNPTLTFWYINRTWSGDTDRFAVYYRTAPNAEWTQIEATEEAHETWTRAAYLLPNPSATYQIAFEMTDGYGHGVGIDDVLIDEPVHLYDNVDNSTTISNNNGRLANVTISGRTLWTDGHWNTLCLPFDIGDLNGTFLAGANIKELDGPNSNLTDGTLTLNFTDVDGGDSQSPTLKAGKPYIVRWGQPVDLTINSADDWDDFAQSVNSGTTTYTGKLVKLGADIRISTMVGTYNEQELNAENMFCGIFDGDGHTLTVDINGGDAYYVAPFHAIGGATIKNLKVEGTVHGGMHCAGLVGIAENSTTNYIQNCEVAAAVICEGKNHTHCGGILGHGRKSTTTISNCLFSGSITGAATATGIIYGWGDDPGKHTIVNCLSAGTYNNCNGIDLLKKNGGDQSITNCYRKTSGGSQGRDASNMDSNELLAGLGNQWTGSNGSVVPKKLAFDNIVDPVFIYVTIDNSAEAQARQTVTFTGGKFVGTYKYKLYNNEDKSILLLGEEDALYWPMSGASIGAFRAYFDLGSNGSAVREFRLNFGNGETSGIMTTDYTDSTDKAGAWYTLDGMKLDNQPSRKGLYIQNGRKVVIK